jgi:hypothetical protein
MDDRAKDNLLVSESRILAERPVDLTTAPVPKLAGYADFRATHRSYLRVRDDLAPHARRATERGLCQKLLQKRCNYPDSHPSKKQATVSACLLIT